MQRTTRVIEGNLRGILPGGVAVARGHAMPGKVVLKLANIVTGRGTIASGLITLAGGEWKQAASKVLMIGVNFGALTGA